MKRLTSNIEGLSARQLAQRCIGAEELSNGRERKLALGDDILMSVSSPARYVGGEVNSVMKTLTPGMVRFAMCFPDVYEIGMSHLGIQILYDMFNRYDDVWCERVYSPWLDLDKIMREKKIPLFALESQEPVKNFDFLGITLQYEMCYTNVLQVLDLSGIPLLAKDRTEEDPIVIGGGPCSYNPEPIAEFFDLFYIGEGETAYRKLLDVYKEVKEKGGSRQEFLLRAAREVPGMYVPSLYEVSYKEDGTIASFVPTKEGVPAKITKEIVMGEIPLDPFENSILLSILGECALALENEKNAREKQEAAILAKNEQLRANLLRAISHDLRTPLTSISGNASNLLSNGDSFDNDTKKQLYMDIYDDSMWLINLVENLLAVTRIEEGRLNLRITEDLMDDVITEALHHINRKSEEHHISVESKEEFLLAKMDAKLIVQVIINIVDNAIKYTPKNSHIVIRTEKRGKQAVVSISDDGNGIADEIKPRIFDMFYSGANQIADSRRSLGLGLSLCKSIINAHGGELTVSDNLPHGTVFTFTLPAGEVKVYE